MSKENRTCILCGKHYYYCPNCRSNKMAEAWKTLYDSANCKNVFDAVSDYMLGVASKDETITKLDGLDLSNVESFKESIKDTIRALTVPVDEFPMNPPVVDESVGESVDVSAAKVVRRKPRQKKDHETDNEV